VDLEVMRLFPVAFVALGALAPAQEPVTRRYEGGVMGTELAIEVAGTDAAELDRALEAAEAELRRLDDLLTDWRPSELTRLNDEAGTGPRGVPPELARIVARSLDIGHLTEGAFDVTYAAVGKLWNFKQEPPRVPASAEIEAALAHVGYARVTVDLERSTIDVPSGMRIGLGGIGQGYGADRAMQVLMDLGVESALINVSGDIKALGTKDGKPWEIAIRHPRDRERVLAVLPVENTCVVTSGDYEKCFELEGRRYHHILDPRTGYPSEGCMSATVVAPDCAAADALATALCVLGPERGLELVERLERVEALLVDMRGEVHASSGLRDRIVPPSATPPGPGR
jgi:thiamine biosynthesis lipoprotein